MTDSMKWMLIGFACFLMFGVSVAVKDHFATEQKIQMRIAACANPDSVACALAVRP
jgi:hypothetical protein